jgi:hypothetical protein
MAVPPSAPIILNAPRSTNQTLEVRWSAPSSTGSAPINQYLLKLYGPTGTLLSTYPLSGTTTYYKIIGLTNDTLYTITVQASNDSGSSYGPIATFRPFSPGNGVPGIPASVLAISQPGYTSAMVSWTAPSILPDSTIYWYSIISESDNPADPVIKRTGNGLTQSSLQIMGLNPSSSYRFSVRAVNCPGYGPVRFTLRVGPAGDITSPLQISNCTLWLDGMDPSNTGTKPSNGTNISTWVDKAGSGYSATGGPYSYETNGLLMTNRMTFALGGIPFPSQNTVFLVAYTTTTTQQYYNFTSNLNTGNSPAFIANYNGTSLEYYNGANRQTLSLNPSGIFVAAYIYRAGTSVVGFFNSSTSVFTINPPIVSNPGPYTDIGSPQINARICEYIIYTKALSSNEMIQVINYLKTKYSIP